MKVLLVEDHDGIAEAVDECLRASGAAYQLVVAQGAKEARQSFNSGLYDFVICDRKIPAEAGLLAAPDEAHGDAVIAELMEYYPGTPIIVLTAFRNMDFLQGLLDSARTGDAFAERVQRPLIRCFDKTRLPECLRDVGAMAAQVRILDDIEVILNGRPPAGRLRSTELRLLRMFARIKGGSQIRVEPIGGGLSGTVTLRVRVVNAHGGFCTSAFVKIGRLTLLAKEHERYNAGVPATLPNWAYAPLAQYIECGAGDVGALVYTLGEGYDRSFFDSLTASPESGALLIRNLESLFSAWHDGAVNHPTTVREVRRLLVEDEAAETLVAGIIDESVWKAFEARQLVVKKCNQHCDLHGENVLVKDDGEMLVIDYGDVRPAHASLDMVALELSLLFHTKNVRGAWHWPSEEQARMWHDVSFYTSGSAAEPFVAACRSAAFRLAAGPREVYASAYAYALRQLKYRDTDKALAGAILQCAVSQFE